MSGLKASLVGLGFATMADVLFFFAGALPLTAWDKAYIDKYGLGGFTEHSVGAYFAGLIIPALLFLIFYVVLLPVWYATRRHAGDKTIKPASVSVVLLVLLGIYYYFALPINRFSVAIFGEAVVINVVLVLRFCRLLDRGLRAGAIHWLDLLKARASHHDPKAQHDLGSRYATGDGVCRDLAKAYVCYSLAAANGHRYAIQSRNTVARDMTSEQLAAAEQSFLALKAKTDQRDE